MTARVILDNVGADESNRHDDRAEVAIFTADTISLRAFDNSLSDDNSIDNDYALLHFTPAKARELAAALLEKADELEGKS